MMIMMMRIIIIIIIIARYVTTNDNVKYNLSSKAVTYTHSKIHLRLTYLLSVSWIISRPRAFYGLCYTVNNRGVVL
jgi:hypothetical protein